MEEMKAVETHLDRYTRVGGLLGACWRVLTGVYVSCCSEQQAAWLACCVPKLAVLAPAAAAAAVFLHPGERGLQDGVQGEQRGCALRVDKHPVTAWACVQDMTSLGTAPAAQPQPCL